MAMPDRGKSIESLESTQSIFVATGSAADVQSMLYVAMDQEYVSEKNFSHRYEKTDKGV